MSSLEAQAEKSREWVRRNTFPAPASLYLEWLTGYVATGRRPTHFYDYPASSFEWRRLMSSCEVPAMYGALAPHLIVPAGMTVTFGPERGHTTIYLMDGFKALGDFIPAFDPK